MQGVADEDLVAKHPDGAIAADAADEEVGRVVVGLDPPGHRAQRCLVDLRRPLHVQCFVGTVFVELLAEAVQLPLLGWQAAGRRDGGLLLERAVYALVDGLLLGPAGLDELGIDAELDEPDGEGGEPGQGAGGEGRAVVGSDAVGDPVGLKSRRACSMVPSREVAG